MKELIELNNHIQECNKKLLTLIKERINKVNYKNDKLKTIVFDKPCEIHVDDGVFLHKRHIKELVNTEYDDAISYRYTIQGNNCMCNDLLLISNGEDLNILYQIVKHLETTNIKDGCIVHYSKPSKIIEN